MTVFQLITIIFLTQECLVGGNSESRFEPRRRIVQPDPEWKASEITVNENGSLSRLQASDTASDADSGRKRMLYLWIDNKRQKQPLM